MACFEKLELNEVEVVLSKYLETLECDKKQDVEFIKGVLYGIEVVVINYLLLTQSIYNHDIVADIQGFYSHIIIETDKMDYRLLKEALIRSDSDNTLREVIVRLMYYNLAEQIYIEPLFFSEA